MPELVLAAEALVLAVFAHVFATLGIAPEMPTPVLKALGHARLTVGVAVLVLNPVITVSAPIELTLALVVPKKLLSASALVLTGPTLVLIVSEPIRFSTWGGILGHLPWSSSSSSMSSK